MLLPILHCCLAEPTRSMHDAFDDQGDKGGSWKWGTAIGGGTRRYEGLQNCGFFYTDKVLLQCHPRKSSFRNKWRIVLTLLESFWTVGKRLEEEEQKKKVSEQLMDFWIRVNRDPVSFNRARTGGVIRKLSTPK